MKITTKEESELVLQFISDLKAIESKHTHPIELIFYYEDMINKYSGIPEFKFSVEQVRKVLDKTRTNE